MKSIINFFIIGIVAIEFISCGSDSGKETDEKVFLNKLSRTWNVGSVEVDGEVVTGAFNGLVVTFANNKTISVTNPVDPIWPATGAYDLVKSGDTFSIDRNDGVMITVMELTESSLIMNFQYSAGARLSSVSGDYTFEMNR